MKDHLKMETHPVACKENVIQGERYPIGIFNLILPILHLILDMAGGPWKFSLEEEHVMGDYLRLRHQMIPYLHTMNYRDLRRKRSCLLW